MDFRIRPMTLEDITQVADIEREAFPTTWPPTPLKKELNNKLARYLVASSPIEGTGGGSDAEPPTSSLEAPKAFLQRLFSGVKSLVTTPEQIATGDWNEFVAGYVGVWFMADEAHITSIAVREELRGRGLGELLMLGTMEMAMARRAQRVTLEARVSNFPAHALYEKYGFAKDGIRRRYYADNREDAVIMTVERIHSPEYQQLFQERVDSFSRRRGEVVLNLA